jgi:hypothetical protein
MNTTEKIGTIRISVVLLLLILTIVCIPQTLAKPQYLAALNFVYGVGSCTSCHTDQNGGKSLTNYGSKFRSQSIYKSDSVIALRAIGAPPSASVTTIPTATIPISTVTMTPRPVAATSMRATPTATPITTVTSASIVIPAEEVRKKSPGFDTIDIIDTIITIGITSTIYMLRKCKIRQ